MAEDFEESMISLAVAGLTKRQLEVLRMVADGEDLVYENGSAYVGYHRTSALTIKALLKVCAISMELGGEVGRFERYGINGTGKEILRRLEKKK